MESSEATDAVPMRHVVYDRFGGSVLRVTESPVPALEAKC